MYAKSSINEDCGLCIFTDGSSVNNIKGGTYGAAIYVHPIKLLCYRSGQGTNNVGELEAIRYGLRLVLNNYDKLSKHIKDNTIYFVSDSQYAIKAVTGVNKVKANEELINKCKYYIKSIEERGNNITFLHIYSHTSNHSFMHDGNRLVDEYALKAAQNGHIDTWQRVK